MTTKLNLTEVTRYTTDKNNKPLVSAKTGKPYTSIRIKAAEYGMRIISGFGNEENAKWEPGQEVEVGRVYESDKKDKDGKPYLNFEMARKEDRVSKSLEEINNRVMKIQLMVEQIGAHLMPAKDPYPNPESVGLSENDMANFDPKSPLDDLDGGWENVPEAQM